MTLQDSEQQVAKGEPEIFDRDWLEALDKRDPRWFSYPSNTPITQTEVFEYVKSRQIDRMLSKYQLKGGHVLEYGCGSAGISIWFANRGFDVVATDLNVSALKVARMNVELHNNPELDFAVADTLYLPFADASFDIVMSWGLLEHFGPDSLAQLMREVTRVIKPVGAYCEFSVLSPCAFAAW